MSLLGGLELVDRAGAGVRDHVDQNIGLDLILRRLQTGQQGDALGPARREPGDRDRLDVAAELLDAFFERLGAPFHADRLVLEHLEVGLRLEVRLRCGIGTVAGGLDLASGLACGVVAGLRGGTAGLRGSDRDGHRHDGEQHQHRSSRVGRDRPANERG